MERSCRCWLKHYIAVSAFLLRGEGGRGRGFYYFRLNKYISPGYSIVNYSSFSLMVFVDVKHQQKKKEKGRTHIHTYTHARTHALTHTHTQSL